MVACLEQEMYDANTYFMDDFKHFHFYGTFLRAIFPQTSVPRVTKHELAFNYRDSSKKHHGEKHTSKAEAKTENIHVINLFRNTLKTNSELAPENGPKRRKRKESSSHYEHFQVQDCC